MKKYTLLLFVLAFIFGLFNVNYTSAANCASGESFNTTTGQSCGNTTAVVGSLVRIAVGDYVIDDSLNLEYFENKPDLI